MTVNYPDKFRQASPASFDGLFDWDFLLSAFAGTKIQPTDIDAVVERHGYFLIFETKDVGKDIPLGQQITLKNLILLGKGKIHLLIIYGKTDVTTESMEEWYYFKGVFRVKERIKCDWQYVLKRVTKWFNWVNKKEAP